MTTDFIDPATDVDPESTMENPRERSYSASMWLRSALASSLLALLAVPACTSGPGGGTPDSEGTTATGDATATSPTGADDSTGIEGDRYHPAGFAAADVHGLASKLQAEDCRSCHGSDLAGAAVGPSCDSCHPADWRTDCVFCHGGQDTMLGAPPRDIDGTTDLASLTFGAHTAHVSDGIHAAFDCLQCHRKPTNVLSEGHTFDDTPGAAEVDFSVGLSAEAQYTAGTCDNLYCHGNGNGRLATMTDDDPAPGCGDCHAYTGSPSARLNAMSGRHPLHANDGVPCNECHAATVDATDTIVGLFLHVNGEAEVVMPAGVTRSGDACTGLCHNKLHFDESW